MKTVFQWKFSILCTKCDSKSPFCQLNENLFSYDNGMQDDFIVRSHIFVYFNFYFALIVVKHPVWYTDGCNILHTLLVKHYNDLLDRQSSERGKDEVTYFYVGDIFCIHLGTKYADFQEKIFAEISGKQFQTLGIT